MKSYMVIGLGRFGSSLARNLCQLGAEVLAMDVRSDLVQQLSNDVTHAVVGDGQDKEVLRALGARNFDCAVIAIGDNLAASVLTVMNLQELGVPYLVCKAHDEIHSRVLKKLGVDRVVIPEMDQAQRLARILHSHNVLDYIELSGLWHSGSTRPQVLGRQDSAGAECPGKNGHQYHCSEEWGENHGFPLCGLSDKG